MRCVVRQVGRCADVGGIGGIRPGGILSHPFVR